MLSARYKYGGRFKLERGSHHVVICGRIDYRIANQILENCFHDDHDVKDLNVVFLSPEDPDLEMEALLKKNFTQVDYLQGDVLNTADLQRAEIREAFACLIIANKQPEKSDAEDALNIMRVISIKNVQPTTRVIVQLLHSHHQMHLLNLPAWNTYRGDTIINLSILKMSLLAKSCEAFGFSTLLSNLLKCYPVVANRTANLTSNTETENDVLDHYRTGCSSSVSFQKLSDFYTGMTFQNAARHMYSYLDILMIGLFERPEFEETSVCGSGELVINPTRTVISPRHMGIFVTQAGHFAERAFLFCKTCHSDVKSSSDIKFCGCENKKSDLVSEVNPVKKFWMNSQSSATKARDEKEMSPYRRSIDESSKSPYRYKNTSRKFPFMDSSPNDSHAADTLRSQYWMTEHSFTNAIVNAETGSRLNNHVVICVLAEADSPLIGLSELIAPLRSRSIPFEQLKDIVLFGNPAYFEREWEVLRHYPRLFIAKGNAVEWTDLEAASIKTCSVCIVISAKKEGSVNNLTEDTDDHDSILTTLNLLSAKRGLQVIHGRNVNDFDGKRLNILTTLKHDESIRFLDQLDAGSGTHKTVNYTQPYVAGEVFMESVLDSLTASAYFNPLAIPLIQSFIFGRSYIQNNERNHDDPFPNASSFRVLPLEQGIFSEYSGGTYKELLLHALHCGVVCIGLHRSYSTMPDDHTDPDSHSLRKRCVITAPPGDLVLQSDDLVFVFASRDDNRIALSGPNDHQAQNGTTDEGPKVSLSILDRLSDALENDRNLYQDGLNTHSKINDTYLNSADF